MTYAVKQNLIDRFGETELAQLTDRTSGTTVNDTVITRALDDADSLINGYLQTRYSLPLTSVPPVLVAAACDIARYYLFEDRVPEIVEKRYATRISWLKDVAAGRASLGLDAAGEETVTETGGVDYTANDRIFTKDALEGF
jgi:phage gp36-like protein